MNGINTDCLEIFRLHGSQTEDVGYHCHAKGEVFQLERGLGVIESEMGRTLVTPHNVGWIPPGFAHRAEEHGDIRGWAVYLDRDACLRLPDKPCLLECSPFVPLVVERALGWNDTDSLDREQVNLLRVFSDELYAAKPVWWRLPFPIDPSLRALARSVADNPQEGSDVGVCAGRVAMSRRNFSRRFREEVGMPFSKWRQLARIYKSRELLAKGRSVQETAWEIGYENVGAYISSFRKVFGVTPGKV